MNVNRLEQEATLVWDAIEALAKRNNITCSALARHSGLDATAFNKSKRYDSTGRSHLPSMKSLIKVLIYTNSTWHDFADLMHRSDSNS